MQAEIRQEAGHEQASAKRRKEHRQDEAQRRPRAGMKLRATMPPTSATPKVATTAAPVGRSRKYEALMPPTETKKPNVQEMSKRVGTLSVNKAANTAGTIK